MGNSKEPVKIFKVMAHFLVHLSSVKAHIGYLFNHCGKYILSIIDELTAESDAAGGLNCFQQGMVLQLGFIVVRSYLFEDMN